MAIVRLEYAQSHLYHTSIGRRLTVGPGLIIGEFGLGLSCHELASPDMGMVYATLLFNDQAGQAWRYSTILGPSSLFPATDQRCRHGRQLSIWQEEFSTVLDYGTPFAIPLDDGHAIQGRLSHTDVRFRTAVKDNLVYVDLAIYVHATSSDGRGGYEHAAYELPVEQFLWRNAPRFHVDDIVWEAEDFVALESAPDPAPFVERSSVFIEPWIESNVEIIL